MTERPQKERERVQDILNRLIDTGRSDTVYRDIYLLRARDFLSRIQPYEEFRDLSRQQAFLADLPNKIRIAMNREDWGEVKELGHRMNALEKQLQGKRTLLELGREIYDVGDVAVDPFSPGLHHVAGVSLKELPALRDRIVKNLGALLEEDPSFAAFYSDRRVALKSLGFDRPLEDDSRDAAMDEADLEKKAQQALAEGNMALLERTAELLLKKKAQGASAPSEEASPGVRRSPRSHRLFPFSERTLSAASKLGLTAAHVDEEKEYASFFEHVWHHPIFGEEPEKAWGPTRILDHKSVPEGPEAWKRRIELYAMHSFINSGGARHLPDFTAEDFLVEDFPDPAEAHDSAETALLSRLTLKTRRRLSRVQIEHALFENGLGIVEEDLGLDPMIFRLVCIPSDLHLRFGQSRGWGRQEIWTHFDGYKIQRDGKMNALAGGDVRFGGIYDFVSIGREYESERVIARFAVVQRKRMTAF